MKLPTYEEACEAVEAVSEASHLICSELTNAIRTIEELVGKYEKVSRGTDAGLPAILEDLRSLLAREVDAAPLLRVYRVAGIGVVPVQRISLAELAREPTSDGPRTPL